MIGVIVTVAAMFLAAVAVFGGIWLQDQIRTELEATNLLQKANGETQRRLVAMTEADVRRSADRWAEPWTSREREAFGINETEDWIKATDRALKDIEWKRRIRGEV